MPQTVALPWGATIEVPDGISADEANDIIQRDLGQQISSYYDVQKMGGVSRFMHGVGHAVGEAARGYKQLLQTGGPFARLSIAGQLERALETPKDVESQEISARQRSAPLMDTSAGFAGDITGGIGMGAAIGAATGGAGLGPIGGGALVGGLQGALTPTVGNESRAANMAEGSIGGAVVGGAANAGFGLLGRVARPFTDRLLPYVRELRQVLLQHGIPLDTAQMTGSRLAQSAKALAQDSPFTVPSLFPHEQSLAFTRAVLRYIGVGNEREATPEIMNAAKRTIQNGYNTIAARTNVAMDDQLETDMVNIMDDIHVNTAGEGQQLLRQQWDFIENQFDEGGGRITGTVYQKITSQLGTMMDDARIAPFAGRLRTMLNDAMRRQAEPEDVQALGMLGQRWAALKAVENSILPSRQISPTTLWTQLGNQQSQAAIYGQGVNAGFARLANAGSALLGRSSELANSQTPRRGMLQAIAGRAFGLGDMATGGAMGNFAQRMVYGPGWRSWVSGPLGLPDAGPGMPPRPLPVPPQPGPGTPGVPGPGTPVPTPGSPVPGAIRPPTAAQQPPPQPVPQPAPVPAPAPSGAATALPAGRSAAEQAQISATAARVREQAAARAAEQARIAAAAKHDELVPNLVQLAGMREELGDAPEHEKAGLMREIEELEHTLREAGASEDDIRTARTDYDEEEAAPAAGGATHRGTVDPTRAVHSELSEEPEPAEGPGIPVGAPSNARLRIPLTPGAQAFADRHQAVNELFAGLRKRLEEGKR